MATNARKAEVRIGSNDEVPITRRFAYDFADEGGAIGAITLKGKDDKTEVIPAGSTIINATKVMRTAFTSGGSATVALGVTGATTGILAATAFNDALHTGTDNHVSAAPLSVGDADVSVIATVATAALTAGAFDLLVTYIPPKGNAAVS